MDKSIVLGALEDLQSLFPCDFSRASGTDEVFSAFSHLDAHILFQMAAALIQYAAGSAAGAGSHREAVVFIQVAAYTLVIGNTLDTLQGTFHRGNAHKAVAIGEHGRDFGDSCAGVFFKCAGDFGMSLQQFLVVDQHLQYAGGINLHIVAILPELFFIRTAEYADPGKAIGDTLGFFYALACFFGKVFHGAVFSKACSKSYLCLLIGQYIRKRVILGGVFIDFVYNAANSANHLGQLHDFGSQLTHDDLLSILCCHNKAHERCKGSSAVSDAF